MDHKKLRGLRHVNRFNFHHVNKKQNVAEHSFYVGIYARLFAEHVFYENPDKHILVSKVLWLALSHDFEEAVIGDIPYLVRKRMPEDFLEELNEIAYIELGINKYDNLVIMDQIVEFADAYELKVYLEEERRSGNKGLLDIERETYQRLLSSGLIELQKFVDELEYVDPKGLTKSLTHEGE